MKQLTLSAICLVAIMCLSLLANGDADEHKHKKVIIHVPYKIHTIHHHTVKKVPVYHYYDHHDHHHHHHHVEKKHEEHEHDWE